MADASRRSRGDLLLSRGGAACPRGALARGRELSRSERQVPARGLAFDPAYRLLLASAFRADEREPVLPSRGRARVHRVFEGSGGAPLHGILRRIPPRDPSRAGPRLPALHLGGGLQEA